MRLLHLISSIDPRAGGPMEGVRQRGLRLLEMGHEVEVACLDSPDAPHVRSFPLTVHALGPTRSTYMYSDALLPWLRANAASYDGVIVNGIWQYHSFAAWRAMRELDLPYVVFTHGMLDPWFKRAYPLKHLKKWLYWPWAEYRVLRDAAAVLFTSEDERLLARQSFWLYRAREVVVSYGTQSPPQEAQALRRDFLSAYPQLCDKRLLLFLGRIHLKKGCDLLIDAFAKVAAQDSRLHLVMAGPDQTGWARELKARARALGIADRISWPGMLQGQAKWGAFYSAEAFVLPSHQENFGIAVAEALACGVPVLISDKVNIWREIHAAGAGLVAADTADGTIRNLRNWLSMSPAEQKAMGDHARTLFEQRFNVDRMATELIDVVKAVHCEAGS